MQKNTNRIRLVRSLIFILSLTCLTMVQSAHAQLTIRGGTFIVKGSNAELTTDRMYVINGAQLTNEGTILVNDTFALRNSGTFFTNTATGTLTGDRVAIFDSASTLNLGDFEISQTFRVRRGAPGIDTANFRSQNGTLAFVLSGNKAVRTELMNQLDLGTLRMSTFGFNTTRLYSSVNTDNLILNNGRIDYQTAGEDSLTVNAGGTITGGNKRSYADSLYRVPSFSGEDLYFPVGNTAIATQFRPFEMVGVEYTTTAPAVSVRYSDIPIATYDSSGLGEVDFTNLWYVEAYGNSIDSFYSRPTIDTNDVANVSQAVVAQSEISANPIFYSMGRNNVVVSGDSVSIEADLRSQEHVVAAIGKASQMNLDIRVFLGGALSGDFDVAMDNYYMTVIDGVMRGRFESGGTSPVPMLPSYNIPTGAVDSIKIYLRTGTAASTTIDSVSAWVMTDGSVRDFASATKNYVTFANANPADGPFYVVVTHRNHLSVMSASPVALTNGIPGGPNVDFSVPGNIFGVGGAGYNMSVSYMWEGNANYDREINASDLTRVANAYNQFGQGATTNGALGYRKSDVDLTESTIQISVNDYNRVSAGNLWIYFSTVPGI